MDKSVNLKIEKEFNFTENFTDHNYRSSFTPDGEKELGKMCYNCKKHLPAKKFKSKRTIRNEVEGIARNEKCRACESINIDVRKTLKLETLENNIDILTQDNEKIKQAFTKVIRSHRQDIDHCMEEIKKLNEEIRLLKNTKTSQDTRNSVYNEDFSF